MAMKRISNSDMKLVFDSSDKDLIDMLYSSPNSVGLHEAGERELQRRYSMRLYYAALFAVVAGVANILVTLFYHL